MNRKSPKQKYSLSKEQSKRQDINHLNYWKSRVNRELFFSYSDLDEDIVNPQLGIVSYLNRSEGIGYILDEKGSSHRFLIKWVKEKKNLDWKKPVLFVQEGSRLIVVAVSAVEISRKRGDSDSDYRTFGSRGKKRVNLRS